MVDPFEVAFKVIFVTAIIVFCLSIVGMFLLIIKLIFLFGGDFIFFGIHFSPEPI